MTPEEDSGRLAAEMAQARSPEFAQRVIARARGFIEAEDPGLLAEMSPDEDAAFLAGTITGMRAAVELIEEADRG